MPPILTRRQLLIQAIAASGFLLLRPLAAKAERDPNDETEAQKHVSEYQKARQQVLKERKEDEKYTGFPEGAKPKYSMKNGTLYRCALETDAQGNPILKNGKPFIKYRNGQPVFDGFTTPPTKFIGSKVERPYEVMFDPPSTIEEIFANDRKIPYLVSPSDGKVVVLRTKKDCVEFRKKMNAEHSDQLATQNKPMLDEMVRQIGEKSKSISNGEAIQSITFDMQRIYDAVTNTTCSGDLFNLLKPLKSGRPNVEQIPQF